MNPPNRDYAANIPRVLLILVCGQYWLYWDALFCLPIGNYMVRVSDILVTVGIAVQYARHQVHSRNMAIFGLTAFFITVICSLGAVLAGVDPRLPDILISSWYFCVPYLLMSVIPRSEMAFSKKLSEITLVWFSMQMLMGASGILVFVGRRLGVRQLSSVMSYGGFYRATNTLGGATSGAHVALFLVAGYLDGSQAGKRRVPVGMLALLGIFLCFSRSAWIEGVIIALWWAIEEIGKASSLKRAMASMIIIVALIGIYKSADPILSRMTDESSVGSDTWRLSKLKSTADSFVGSNRYFVGTGWGTGYLRSFVPSDTMPVLVTEGWDPSAIDLGAYSLGKPHNTYLVILNEIGLVGSALLAIMFVFAILLPMSRSRGASFYGVLAALVGIMNTETSLLAPKTGYAFALMIWHGTLRRKNNQQRNCVARKPW